MAPSDLSISYAFVIVKLQNHAAKGLKKILLAQEIEKVIQWKPGEEGILDGTPEDQDLNISNTIEIFILVNPVFFH